MAVDICGLTIETVAIIDDQPEVRQGYEYTVENASLTPLSQEGPLGNSIPSYLDVSSLVTAADAGLCDFQLSTRAYATFSGAELVAELYRQNFPALLCTRWEKVALPDIAPHRRWIPSLLAPHDLNEESLVKGIEECIFELQGNFRPSRRPWRSQVHFLQPVDDSTFSAEIPGWELDEVVNIRLSDIPAGIREKVKLDFRCYAHVNLGAEKFEDLYWYNWEAP